MELPKEIKDYLDSVRNVSAGEVEMLRLAVVALGDLGACDDDDCECDQCVHALPILKKTMEILDAKMGGPVCGSGIGSEVGLATDPSRHFERPERESEKSVDDDRARSPLSLHNETNPASGSK